MTFCRGSSLRSSIPERTVFCFFLSHSFFSFIFLAKASVKTTLNNLTFFSGLHTATDSDGLFKPRVAFGQFFFSSGKSKTSHPPPPQLHLLHLSNKIKGPSELLSSSFFYCSIAGGRSDWHSIPERKKENLKSWKKIDKRRNKKNKNFCQYFQ